MDEERGIGERGPDKTKRDFNPKSLSNLKQFQNPVSNVNSTVNVGVNWSKIGKIVLIGFVISFIIWKIHQRRGKSDDENETDPNQNS